MPEKFDSKEYREKLAEEIKAEPEKEKRREILEKAKTTEEYKEAKEEHLTEIQKFLFEREDVSQLPFFFSFDKDSSRREGRSITRLKETAFNALRKQDLNPEALDIYLEKGRRAFGMPFVGEKGYLGITYPFVEKVLINPELLKLPERFQDFTVIHEALHGRFQGNLAKTFYQKHPEVRMQKEALFEKYLHGGKIAATGLSKGTKLHDLVKRESLDLGIDWRLMKTSQATDLLDHFLTKAEEYKPIYTVEEKRKLAIGLEIPGHFDLPRQAFSPEKYDEMVTLMLLEVGESLTKNVEVVAASKQFDAAPYELVIAEEGVANYLASKFSGLPLEDVSKILHGYIGEKERGIGAAFDMQKKYGDNYKSVVERLRAGEAVFSIYRK